MINLSKSEGRQFQINSKDIAIRNTVFLVQAVVSSGGFSERLSLKVLFEEVTEPAHPT